MGAHLAVIDPALRIPELDCFNRMSQRSRIPLTYHLPALFGTASLARGSDELAGIVILGSGASVNDDSAWERELEAWLVPRILRGVPTLGLCFGHQFVVRALGGEVADVFPVKRAGLREISLVADRLWGDPCSGPVLVSHRQAAVRLPDGLEVVGRSDEVGVEAVAHQTLPVWGFQSHPEATLAFAKNNHVPFEEPPSTLTFGHRLVDAFLDFAAAAGVPPV